jgi:hypothetical protein
MSLLDSTIDARAIEHARLLLHPAPERDNRAAAIAAAAAFALAGLAVSVTVITTTLARPAEHASALRPAQ